MRRVAVHGRMRMVVVPGAAVEFAAARCAHAVRGAGRFGVGGSSGGGVHRYSHRAVQLEEEQNKSEHRAARCVCGRHSYLHEVLLGRKRGSSVLTTRGSESELLVCAFCLARFHVSERARFPHKFLLRPLFYRGEISNLPSSVPSYTAQPADLRNLETPRDR